MEPTLLEQALADSARGRLPKAVIPTDLTPTCICAHSRDLRRHGVPVICDSAEAVARAPAGATRAPKPGRRLFVQRQQDQTTSAGACWLGEGADRARAQAVAAGARATRGTSTWNRINYRKSNILAAHRPRPARRAGRRVRAPPRRFSRSIAIGCDLRAFSFMRSGRLRSNRW
jgi:hypothetical protein